MISRRGEFYALPHITGPGAVLVSVKFGPQPEAGPTVVRLDPVGPGRREVEFDLQRHLREIDAGVAKANEEFGGGLQVAAVEVVPDDYPQRGQAEAAAYRIARAVLQHDV